MASLTEAGRQLKSRYLSSLASEEYRKLWLATVCSQSSAWALIVARAALILQLTGSAAWTGYVTFAAMIPAVFVSPLAGYLSDRFDRRTVLAAAYAVNLADSLVLAILVATRVIEPWHLLVLAAITGSARATQMPASQALLANTVPREHLLNAVSLHTATQQGARFVGPFLILVVLWATGQQNWEFVRGLDGVEAVGALHRPEERASIRTVMVRQCDHHKRPARPDVQGVFFQLKGAARPGGNCQLLVPVPEVFL